MDIDWCGLYTEKTAYLTSRYDEVEPFQFYSEVFHGDRFERRGRQDDALPNGLALVIKGGRRAHHRIITDGFPELPELLKEPFVITSPISYFGERRDGRNARFAYAVVFDLDGVSSMQRLIDLLHQIDNGVTPRPSFLVNSGRGLHLYYVLEDKIPLYPKNQNFLRQLKSGLTRVIWNGFTSDRSEPEAQGILQGYRMVGSLSKLGEGYPLRAYRLGKSVSVDYLISFVPESNGQKQKVLAARSRCGKMSLEEAKIRYPEWYDRRIVRGEPRGQWKVKPDLYYWWYRRLRDEIRVGHRYNGVLALAVYARKCPDITEEQLRSDAYDLIPLLDKMTTDPHNHFSEDDVTDALEAYYDEENDNYVRWRRDYIEHLTALEMPKNKRNGRKQAAHLARARAVQMIDYPDGEWRYHGNKRDVVVAYLAAHPDARKCDVIRETGLSKPTVYKYFDEVKQELHLKVNIQTENSHENIQIEVTV